MAHPTGQKTTDLLIFRRLLRQARPYAWRIAGILGLSLLSTPLAVLMPLPLKIVVDNVLGDAPVRGFLAVVLPSRLESSSTSLPWLAVALLLIALLNQVQALELELASTDTGERLVLDFRSERFRHAQRLSLGYH
ncbi:MAG: ABC transporter ATP-binding protein, partial [Actinomycetota bacterium]|nr:ABC transporter ATP-binding protein [Actinomycetota bacterium]